MGDFTTKQKELNAFMWTDLLKKSDLPAISTLLGIYLATYMNGRSNVAWPSLTTITKETRLSRPTVCKHIKILEREGWIEKEKGASRASTRYTAIAPAAALECQPETQQETQQETQTAPPDGLSSLTTLVKEINQGSKAALPQGLSSLTTGVKEVYPNNKGNNKGNNKDLKKGDDLAVAAPPEEKPKPKRKAKAHAAVPDVVPDGLNMDALELWLQYKAERREWYQPIGITSLIAQMSKREYSEQMEQVERASANGWKGIQWPREQREQRQANHETMTDLDRRVIERIMNTPPAKPKKRKLSIY
jgi:DNA-binding MarR family transcriptional regulator